MTEVLENDWPPSDFHVLLPRLRKAVVAGLKGERNRSYFYSARTQVNNCLASVGYKGSDIAAVTNVFGPSVRSGFWILQRHLCIWCICKPPFYSLFY